MSHRVVIERADGGVSVTQLTDEFYRGVASGVLQAIAAGGDLAAGDPWSAQWVELASVAIEDTAVAWAKGPPHVLTLAPLERARHAALEMLERDAAGAEARRTALAARAAVVAAAAADLMAISRRRLAVPDLPDVDVVAAQLDAARLQSIGVEVDKIAAGSGFVVKGWHESSVDQLPADRTFRNAWQHAGSGKVAVHIGRARETHLERLRAARAPALAHLDVRYQQADEAGDVARKATIAKVKQELRDLPKTLDLSRHATPEALAAAWPPNLPRST